MRSGLFKRTIAASSASVGALVERVNSASPSARRCFCFLLGPFKEPSWFSAFVVLDHFKVPLDPLDICRDLMVAWMTKRKRVGARLSPCFTPDVWRGMCSLGVVHP